MDKQHASKLLQAQEVGKGIPNRKWAYDILKRAGKDPLVTPAALEIARNAIRNFEAEDGQD